MHHHQGLQRVADTSLPARAAWAAGSTKYVYDFGLPSVRLLSGTTMADPVGFDAALAGDLVGVEPCLIVQLPIPALHHWMPAFCQGRVTLLGLLAVLCTTNRAAAFLACAAVDCGLPFMPVLTSPNQNLVAESHVLISSAWVLVTELGSNGRKSGGK